MADKPQQLRTRSPRHIRCHRCKLLIGSEVLAPRNYDGLCPRCGADLTTEDNA